MSLIKFSSGGKVNAFFNKAQIYSGRALVTPSGTALVFSNTSQGKPITNLFTSVKYDDSIFTKNANGLYVANFGINISFRLVAHLQNNSTPVDLYAGALRADEYPNFLSNYISSYNRYNSSSNQVTYNWIFNDVTLMQGQTLGLIKGATGTFNHMLFDPSSGYYPYTLASLEIFLNNYAILPD